MDKYRLLSHRDEFLKMIQHAPLNEIGEIWQTLPFRRNVYEITKLELLSEAMIFVTNLPFEFDENFPIFIKINYKNIIFKLTSDEFKAYNTQLSCSYPKEVKALEDRRVDRMRLPRKSHLNVTLRTIFEGEIREVKVGLEDVSEHGIGIRTSCMNVEIFSDQAFFKLVGVCGQDHVEEVSLTVKHISKKDHLSSVGIGLSADKSFSGELFEILKHEISNHDIFEGLSFS